MLDPERRKKIDGLFRDALDLKRLKGQTSESISLLRGALELALLEGSPWRQRVSYRLAHLLMRTAAQDKLREIAALFEAAASSDALAARANVYRLAALKRAAASDDELRSAVKTAHESVAREARRVADQNREDDLDVTDLPLQQEIANLLELAVYFLGTSYPLDGLGALDEGRTGWRLLGHDHRLGQIALTREFALEELARVEREQPDAILYVLPDDGGNGSWKLRRESKWNHRPATHFVRLIALLQARHVRTIDALREQLADGLDRPTFDVTKSRLAKAVGLETEELFDETSGRLLLGEKLVAYGAVSNVGLTARGEVRTRKRRAAPPSR